MVTSVDLGKAGGILRGDGRIARPVVVPRDDFLRLRRVQVLEVGVGHLPGALAQRHLVHDRHRRLGQDAHRRHDDIHLARTQCRLRQKCLVLPAHQDVAEPALDEGGAGGPGARIQHRDVPEQPGQVGLGTRLRRAGLAHGPCPGSQVIPPGAAGGLRIGRDHLDARAREVAPVPDALRVALAHQEHDGRRVGRAVVRQPALPVRRQRLALGGDGVDVVGERQRDHIGGQAVDDRTGLLAGAAVGLADRHGVAGLRLPVRRECRVVILVELAGGVVGRRSAASRWRRGRRTAAPPSQTCESQPEQKARGKQRERTAPAAIRRWCVRAASACRSWVAGWRARLAVRDDATRSTRTPWATLAFWPDSLGDGWRLAGGRPGGAGEQEHPQGRP